MKNVIRVALIAAVLCMCMAVLSVSAKVQYGNVNVTSDAGTTVTYELTSAPEGEGAVLVAALVNVVTNEVIEINWTKCDDVSTLTGTPKTLSVSLTGTRGGNTELRHYLWNNLTDMQSMKNFEPASPVAGVATGDITTANMTWSAPDDDYDSQDDLKYNIYDDGLLVTETPVSGLEYNAENLAPGANFNFEVKALDSVGAESSASDIMAASTYMPNTLITNSKPRTDDDPIGITSKDGNVTYAPKASVGDTTYYTFKQDNVGGLNCLSTTVVYRATSGNDPNYTRALSRMGFKLKNPVEGDNAWYAYEITYFDRYEEENGIAKLQMQYYMKDGNDANELYDSASTAVNLENDNAWKTVKGTFKAYTQLSGIPTSGTGADASANGSMMALWNSRGWNAEWQENRNPAGLEKEYLYENDYLKVYKVTLMPLDETYENYKKLSGASLVIENPTETEAATIISGLDCNAKGFSVDGEKALCEKGGRLSVALSDIDNTLTFTVKDTEIRGQAGKIELCCYAEEDTTVVLSDGQTATIPANTWRKIRFSQDTVSDNEYSVTADNDLYISSLRVTAN